MIYIQSTNSLSSKGVERTIPHHFDVACAMYGAIESGIDYRLTSFEEVQSGKFNALIKTNLFVGSSEFMQEVFFKIGKSPKLPINSDRTEDIVELKKARERIENGETLFVKSVQNKLISGAVVDKFYLSTLAPYPEDTQVIICEPFNGPLVSEWRCYVHMGKIVDARHYAGDFKIQPEWDELDEKIKKLDFPIAYTIDAGVVEHPFAGGHETVVVEFNDMVHIGNYGMENRLYLRLLRERYFEIVQRDKFAS